jgi:tripartite-type tricarboxylate transporter receptor subunit TctC
MNARFSILLVQTLSAVALAVAAAFASAQTYPTKPLRVISPFAAGGGVDFTARVVAQKLTEGLGQTTVVDNRAGAAGVIGTELAARAAPDGYTLLLGSAGPMTILPAMGAKLPYDPIKDFAPITLVTSLPYVLVVHPSLPVRNVKELLALARAKPGQLNFGSPGNGTTTHLATELLKMLAKVDAVHIPYKGVAPAVTDLLAGQVQFMSGDLSTMMPLVKSGRLRALGVTSAKRSSVVPELPTIAESGVPGFEASGWFGMLAPAATPPDIVSRVNAVIVKGIATPDTREKLASLGGDVVGGTAAEFAAYMRAELAKWAKVIKTIGLKPEQPS